MGLTPQYSLKPAYRLRRLTPASRASWSALTGSVARYVWDLADPTASGWIVPLGASGAPDSAHFTDQTEQYVRCELAPVHSPAVSTLRLQPG